MKKIIYLFTLLNFAFSLLGCGSQSQINRLRPLATPQSFINYLDSHSDEKKNVEWSGSTYDFTENRSFYKKGKESSNFLGTCFFSTERGDETQELPSNFWGLITITIIYPVSNGFFSKSYYRYNMTFNYKFDVRVAFDNPIGDIFADTVGPSNHFFTNSETFTKINNFFSQAAKENND